MKKLGLGLASTMASVGGALLLTASLHVPGWGMAGAAMLAWGMTPYIR